MATYRINKTMTEVTEKELADLYFKKHPGADAVTSSRLIRWAKSYYKSDLIKVAETEYAI